MKANLRSFEAVKPKLSDVVLKAINEEFGFKQMTPVQTATIPVFLSHKDVLVQVL